LPILANLVAHVLLLASSLKVERVAARRVIAKVHDHRRPVTVPQPVRYTVGAPLLPSNLDEAIAVSVLSAFPGPALVGSSLVHSFPEAVFDVLLGFVGWSLAAMPRKHRGWLRLLGGDSRRR